jgi:hypothetical protein
MEQPGLDVGRFVLHDVGWLSDVRANQVHTTVIVQIDNGQSPTHSGPVEKFPGVGRDFLKLTVYILPDESRLGIGLIRFIVIGVAIGDDQIWPAIQIQIDKGGTPTDHRHRIGRQTLNMALITIPTLPSLLVQIVVLAHIIGNENLEVQIVIDIGGGNPHSRL